MARRPWTTLGLAPLSAEQARRCVAQVMDADVGQAGALECAMQGSRDTAGVLGIAEAVSEDN